MKYQKTAKVLGDDELKFNSNDMEQYTVICIRNSEEKNLWYHKIDTLEEVLRYVKAMTKVENVKTIIIDVVGGTAGSDNKTVQNGTR